MLLCLYKLLLNEGQSPSRLKAFTLTVDGEGDDARQAREFLTRVDLEMLGEVIDVPSSALDPLRAVAVIEDYKPLDVECADGQPRAARRDSRSLSRLASPRGRRRRRREPQGLSDRGEQRADDPKRRQQPHALSGRVGRRFHQALDHVLRRIQPRMRAQLRVRASASASLAFSPYTRPYVIAVAEAIPFAAAHRRLARAAVRAQGRDREARNSRQCSALDMPVFREAPIPARVGGRGADQRLFPQNEARYRRHFESLHAATV